MKLLDLFCGAGGASVGYNRAGFDVVGVDINPQKNYPFEFHQGDALEFLKEHGHEFDAIHASPPCQRHSAMSNCRPGLAESYPDLVAPTRDLLMASGKPWVIENVPGSPLIEPVTLCGTSFLMLEPSHPEHVIPASKAGHWKPGTVMSVSGHIAPIAKARKIMDIDWTNREELAEAIPPYFTKYVGGWLRAEIALATANG